jgi:hypothetical protein
MRNASQPTSRFIDLREVTAPTKCTQVCRVFQVMGFFYIRLRNYRRLILLLYVLQLEYLDETDLRRGVGEIRVVVERDPAC